MKFVNPNPHTVHLRDSVKKCMVSVVPLESMRFRQPAGTLFFVEGEQFYSCAQRGQLRLIDDAEFAKKFPVDNKLMAIKEEAEVIVEKDEEEVSELPDNEDSIEDELDADFNEDETEEDSGENEDDVVDGEGVETSGEVNEVDAVEFEKALDKYNKMKRTELRILCKKRGIASAQASNTVLREQLAHADVTQA